MATELQKHGEGATRAAVEHATTGLMPKEIGTNTDSTQQELIYALSTSGHLHFPSLERLDNYGAGASGAMLIGVEDDSFSQITGDTDLQASLKSIDTLIDGLVTTTISGFTEGAVLFANSSGNLAEDDTNFFWDDTANELQITGLSVSTGHITLEANSDLLLSSTSDITGTNFDVDGATGDLTANSLSTGDESFTYNEGSFTMTGTGFTSNPTGTAYWVRFGSVVTLTIPDLSGTSNAGTFTLTGAPSEIQPARLQYMAIAPTVSDNSSQLETVNGYIDTGGVISLFIWTGSAYGSWTTSGTKQINGYTTITYLLT